MSFQSHFDALTKRRREIDVARFDALKRQDLKEAYRLLTISHRLLAKRYRLEDKASRRGKRVEYHE